MLSRVADASTNGKRPLILTSTSSEVLCPLLRHSRSTKRGSGPFKELSCDAEKCPNVSPALTSNATRALIQRTDAHPIKEVAVVFKCPVTRLSKAIRISLQAALSLIQKMRPIKWKWLAVSALVAASIIASCGQSESCTRPLCTSISMAIRGLLLHTEAPQPAHKNNSIADITYQKTTHYTPRICKNSFAHCEKQIKITKSDTFTVANTAHWADPIIISVYSTIPSRIWNFGKTIRVCTPSLQKHFKNIGPTASAHALTSIYKTPLILPVTHLKKLPAKGPMIITYATTKTAKPSGFCRNTYGCRPVVGNPAA